MIHRIKGEIVFECDSCGETLETGETEFDFARDKLIRADWKSKKVEEGFWTHQCNECRFIESQDD